MNEHEAELMDREGLPTGDDTYELYGLVKRFDHNWYLSYGSHESVRAPELLKCVDCGEVLGLSGKAFYGAGGSSGSLGGKKFRCETCHERIEQLDELNNRE